MLAPALSGAAGFRLAPWKDDLFAYPKVLATAYGGDYRTIEFSQQRDVTERDDKPDEKTKDAYVSLDVKAAEKDLVLKSGGVEVKYVGVGKLDGGASMIVLFIHGWQATRHDGVNDWRSGGNLNRIKNLMVRNGGVYLSPDYAGVPWRANRQVKALLETYAAGSPGAPVVLACASLGARICFDLMRDPKAAALIDGLIFFAGVSDPAFVDNPAVRSPAKRIPILMSHGNKDDRVGWRAQDRLYRSIRQAVPDYPIRFVLFDTGTHRSPLRMTDWRETLNWMLEVNEARGRR